MNDICGQIGTNSSPSADLQSSLESRLRVRLEGIGSQLFGYKWKLWDMPSGLPICALRASGHRTLGNVCSGWGTPTAGNFQGTPEQAIARKVRAGMSPVATMLTHQVQYLGPMSGGSIVETGEAARLNPEHARWLIGLPPEWSECAPTEMR